MLSPKVIRGDKIKMFKVGGRKWLSEIVYLKFLLVVQVWDPLLEVAESVEGAGPWDVTHLPLEVLKDDVEDKVVGEVANAGQLEEVICDLRAI